MTEPIDPQLLQTLGRIQTCAIANAIETFDIRPRTEGFMGPQIRCMFPDLGGMIGYAVTAVITASMPPSPHMSVSRVQWVDEILKIPEPRVIVVKDLDYPNPVGSFWGEVQSNLHKALGCVGTVTDGGVRDLDEMHALGFHAFASAVLVSHAYVHLVEVNVPITVGGLTVRPGDILLGDKHGVINIPRDIAPQLPEAVRRVEERERRLIGLAQSPDFTPEGLKELLREMYG